MSNANLEKKLTEARDATVSKFGPMSASIGNEHYGLNVVPTPSLMLDYKLGIGGFPYGHLVEVYGSNGLGKTSALGYGTLANVQRQNKLPAIIAAEPTFDPKWAQKLHGLDPNILLVNRPDTAEEAFEMLQDLVYGNLVDYILLDSIGALAAASEAQEEGKKKAFGISGIVTSGLNRIMSRLYKNNQGLMIINQQRQDTKAGGNVNMTLYESPGGEALKHNAMIRIQLKPGRERFTAKLSDEKKPVQVGRELVCSFKKNKLAQAANKRAEFNFFHIDTPEYGLGVDHVNDILNTARVAGVIEGTTWLKHDSFPGGKLQGRKALAEFIEKNPDIVETIRSEVMSQMIKNELKAAEENENKKATEVVKEAA